MNEKWVIVFDVDGVFTPGNFFYTKDGKVAKEFGADDYCAVKELMKYANVHIISADKKGFDIVRKRFQEELGWPLSLVANKPIDVRLNWMKKKFPNQKICYVADGIWDYYSFRHVDYSCAPQNSLNHVKQAASYISERNGGDRFVADVCLHILNYVFNVNIL